MNTKDLKKQAELVINPIEIGTNLKFKVKTINIQTKLRYNENEYNEYLFVDNWTMYYSETPKFEFWITHTHNREFAQFKLEYRKNTHSGRTFTEHFNSSLELITFLNQSKFKK